MINNNKGIATIAILGIILGVLIVGGGAYYIGENKGENKKVENPIVNIEENLLAEEEQKTNTTSSVVSDCDSNSKPSIKVLSPNGGEVYKEGDKISVKWESCNLPVGVDVGIALLNQIKTNTNVVHVLVEQTKDDGNETITLLPQKNMQKFMVGNKFKISLNYVFTEKYTGPYKEDGRYPEWTDRSLESENYFTINSAAKDVSTANWKTFGNYGLSFKYPDTWSKFGEDSKVGDLSGNVTAIEINFNDATSNTTVLVSYHLPPNGSKLYDYAVSEFNSKNGWYKTGSKEIIVAGSRAIEAFTTMSVTGRGNKIDPPLRLIIVDFLDKQKTGSIQIQFKTPLPNEDIEVAKFNKFLSTFQFLLPQ